MAKRISDLDADQLASLASTRDEWLARGLSTRPADRVVAEDGVRAAYRAAGLEPPKFMIWLGSPWAGVIGWSVGPGVVARALGHAQVDAQVHAQVRAQVDVQVDDQVDDQVHLQVDDQVYLQVHAQVHDQVYAQVDAQVHDQVYAQVDDQVYAQVYDQVNVQVRAQVYAQVDVQVDDQVRDQVHDQVNDQVYAQVDAQVDDQVRDQVHDQVYLQVDAQVDAQVYDQVHDQVNAQVYAQVHDQVAQVAQVHALHRWRTGLIGGHLWAGYYSYFAAMRAIGVTGLEPISGTERVAKAAGWWWAFREFAILTERPTILRRDERNRLHCSDGPAMTYPDGWSIYAWHGTRVPRELIDGEWSAANILKEPNAEIRRCAIERMGWPEFVAAAGLSQVGGSVADPGNPGCELTLYDVPRHVYGAPVRVLLCVNATPERDGTRRRYGLTVPAEIHDPLSAAAWTFNVDPSIYAGLARAS